MTLTRRKWTDNAVTHIPTTQATESWWATPQVQHDHEAFSLKAREQVLRMANSKMTVPHNKGLSE